MVRSPIPGLFCPDTDRTPAAFPARLNAQRIPTHLRGLYRRAAVQQRLVLPGNAAVLGIEPGPAAAPHRVGAVVSNLSADGRNGNRAAQCHKIHRSPAVDVSRRTAGAAAGVLPVCDQSNTVVEPARSAAAGAGFHPGPGRDRAGAAAGRSGAADAGRIRTRPGLERCKRRLQQRRSSAEGLRSHRSPQSAGRYSGLWIDTARGLVYEHAQQVGQHLRGFLHRRSPGTAGDVLTFSLAGLCCRIRAGGLAGMAKTGSWITAAITEPVGCQSYRAAALCRGICAGSGGARIHRKCSPWDHVRC